MGWIITIISTYMYRRCRPCLFLSLIAIKIEVDPFGLVPVFAFFFSFFNRVPFEGFVWTGSRRFALCTRSHQRHGDMGQSTGRGLAETRDTTEHKASNNQRIDELQQWRDCKMKGFISRNKHELGQARVLTGGSALTVIISMLE